MSLLTCLRRGKGEGAGLLSVVWSALTGHFQACPLADREMRNNTGHHPSCVRRRRQNNKPMGVVGSLRWPHKDEKAQKILAIAKSSTLSGWLMEPAACVTVLTSGIGPPPLPPLPHHSATHAKAISELGQIHLQNLEVCRDQNPKNKKGQERVLKVEL